MADLPIPAPERWHHVSTPEIPTVLPPARWQPVKAQLVFDPCDGPVGSLCAAAIRVTRDPRPDAMLYAIEVAGRAPLVLTHAQLAALVLGANALFAQCHYAGVPQ